MLEKILHTEVCNIQIKVKIGLIRSLGYSCHFFQLVPKGFHACSEGSQKRLRVKIILPEISFKINFS